MGQTKKPRKAYRPRAISLNSHLTAMLGSAWVDEAEIVHRTKIIGAAADAVCMGRGEPTHWRALFDAINLLDALGELGVVTVSGLDIAMATVENVMNRKRDAGTAAMRAEERQAIRDLAAGYLETLPHLTNSDLMRAESRVAEAIRRALAGASSERIVAAVTA